MDVLTFDSPVLILLIGFSYTVIFGLLSVLRREGLSVQFAVESVVITLMAAAVSQFVRGSVIHPALFLLVLYLITMRVRICVEFANYFARSGKLSRAEQIYTLGERLLPDRTNRLIVRINFGTLRLQQGSLDESISVFNEILQQAEHGFLGVKYEAAAHYNLGVAFLRKGMETKAKDAFHSVLETWPMSEYGQRAEAALKKLPHK
jgi:tetratricopeptide (TPR) repeat protein